MHIICCYTSICPETLEALAKYAPEAEMVRTPGLFGYCDALEHHWDTGDDLVVIEGDKVITAEVMSSFSSCNEPWCSYKVKLHGYGYRLGTEYTAILEATTGLGCTKFSADIQRQVSADEFLHNDGDSFWPPCPFCQGEGCWNYLDLRIARAILSRGVGICVHGEVEHIHEQPRAGKISDIDDAKLRAFNQAAEELAGPAWPRED